MPSKRYSENLWRSTKESGSPSRTWWRVRRELGLQWNEDGVRRRIARRRRTEMKKRDPRMALGKVRRRELCCLSLIRIIVFVFNFLLVFYVI